MDNKKFEQLIELIINEDEEKARALFHDIVVEKSREIYESMMDEEMVDSPVEGLMDEISAEEAGGMTEEEDEFADIEADDGDMDVELDADDMGGEEGEEDLEDRVVDLEDKLDQLMAEFEDLMGQEGGEDMGDEEGLGDEGDEMMESSEDDEEEVTEGKEEDDEEEVTEAEEDDDEEETLEEAVQLQKVSVTHGDNGAYTKSPGLNKNTKVSDNGAKAVKFDQGGDSTKGGTQGGLLNPTTKDLKGAGSFKNAPGKGNFSEKGEAAPKPKAGDNGQNTKSIVGESKKVAKKPVTATTTKKIVKK